MKRKLKTTLLAGLMLGTTAFSGVALANLPVKAEETVGKAKVAIIIDDCYSDNETYGTESIVSLFDEYNAKLGLGIITDWSTGINGISANLLRKYYANGHEILSHSASHENKWVNTSGNTIYTADQAIAEIEESMNFLNILGIRNVNGFITPYTTTDSSLLTAVKDSNLCTDFYGVSTNNSQNNDIICPRIYLNTGATEGSMVTTSVDALTAELNALMESGGSAVYFTHKTSEWSLDNFEAMLTFIQNHSNEIEIVTPHELVSGSAYRYDEGEIQQTTLISSEVTASSVLEIDISQELPENNKYADIILRYAYPSATQSATRYPTITLSGAAGSQNISGYGFKADGNYHTIRLNTSLLSDIDISTVNKITISVWSPFNLQNAYVEWFEFPELNYTAAELVDAYQVGWCLGNVMEIPIMDAEETRVGCPYTTQEMIDEVARKGFKSMRLNASWEYHLDSNGYIKKPYIRRVKQILDYAINAGLYVILDHHHTIENANGIGTTDPIPTNELRAKASIQSIWNQVATYFANYGQELSFEVLNEPRDRSSAICDAWTGNFEAFNLLNQYNEVAIHTIRATGGNNANRLIIIPTYCNGPSIIECEAVVIPEDAGNVAVAIHAYEPHAFAFQGSLAHSTFTDEGRANLDTLFNRLNEYFVSEGVPVVITETSATFKNNDTERAAWAEYFTSKAAQYNIPCFLWDNHQEDTSDVVGNNQYKEGFGFFNRRELTWWHESVVNAFINGANYQDTTPDFSQYAEEKIFDNGIVGGSYAGGGTNTTVFNNEVNANVWEVAGNWTSNRIVFTNTMDTTSLSEEEVYVYLRYKTENASWPEIRLLNSYGNAGDMKYASVGVELANDGIWHDLYLPLSNFSQAAGTTLWGATCDTSFDYSQIKGIALQFGGTILIEKISFMYQSEETPQPPIVPEVPQTPSSVAVSLGENSVSITFSAVEGASHYIIQRSISWSVGYEQIGSTTTNEYIDTQVVSGTRYYYRIIAVNSVGSSEASEPKGITVS